MKKRNRSRERHTRTWAAAIVGFAGGLAATVSPLPAAEIKLFDGQRLAALIEAYDRSGEMTVFLTSGERKRIPLYDITAIHFSGRSEYFIRTGDQACLFNTGGQMCGAVEELQNGDVLVIQSQSLGRHALPLRFLRGFIGLAMGGRPARLAEDMMRGDGSPPTAERLFLDHIVDRRGVPFAGVLESFTPRRLEFEHDEQLQQVKIDTFRVAGVRLAEAGKARSVRSDPVETVHVGILCRDRSYLIGHLTEITPFQWTLQPDFDRDRRISIPASELIGVEVLGGRTVFLSHLDPISVQERTILAPPQPFQRNVNTQGDNMDIGGFIYHKGLGVHARSQLAYRLGGKFKRFKADVGIDGRLEKNGTVVFSVWGDGRELFKTPLIRGRVSGGGYPIDVSVEGVQTLTLQVDSTDDLDQADVANWGAARLER